MAKTKVKKEKEPKVVVIEMPPGFKLTREFYGVGDTNGFSIKCEKCNVIGIAMVRNPEQLKKAADQFTSRHGCALKDEPKQVYGIKIQEK